MKNYLETAKSIVWLFAGVVVLALICFTVLFFVRGGGEWLGRKLMGPEASDAASSEAGGFGGGKSDKSKALASTSSGAGQTKVLPWIDYDIISHSVQEDFTVAGRKQAISYDVRIEPYKSELPNRAQLRQIAEKLFNDEYNSTRVYFYLPGMDTQQRAWATVRFTPDGKYEMSVNDAAMPVVYRSDR